MDAMDALPPFEDLVASVLIHLLQVALVMDAMDVHDGFLSEQQFRDIVEAEAIVSHSQVGHRQVGPFVSHSQPSAGHVCRTARFRPAPPCPTNLPRSRCWQLLCV